MPLEATDVIEAPLLIDARCQRFDTQVERHHLPGLWLGFLYRIDKGSIVVPSGITADGDFPIASRHLFSQSGSDRGEALRFFALATRWEQHCGALNLDVHGRIAEGEELMAWPHAREAGGLAMLHAPKERLHRLVQPEIDFCQELAVHIVQIWVIRPAFSQPRLFLCEVPALSVAQPHHQPVVEAATLALHTLQSSGVLLTHL